MELPWEDRVNMLSVNPHAATIKDIADMAAELSEIHFVRATGRKPDGTIVAEYVGDRTTDREGR